MSQHRRSPATTLNDTADAALGLALLWALPAIAFLLILVRF